MHKKVILPQKNPDLLDIIQITDCHIFPTLEGRFDGVNTAASLGRVIDRINAAESPDIVLVTGDLVNDPEAPAYERLLALLERLNTRVYCLPGNHDLPALMHRLINTANVATDNVLEGRHWRIVLLDTMLPGTHSGILSEDELAFLEETLSAAGDQFILVAMHHHPVPVDSPWMDTMMLENPAEFFTVIDRYPAVKGITWGHVHQLFSRQHNAVRLLGTPSTCRQFMLEGESAGTDDKPPAYRRIRLHRDGRLCSEVQWLADYREN
jgi:Icc protein